MFIYSYAVANNVPLVYHFAEAKLKGKKKRQDHSIMSSQIQETFRLACGGQNRKSCCRLTASSLVLGVLGLLNIDDLTTLPDRGSAGFAFERLAGHDAVDFYKEKNSGQRASFGMSVTGAIPVRMFWKASSTLLASSAEVSMKERLFSPIERKCQRQTMQACKENSLANCLASSVGTARRCLKSLLLPTSIMTMLESAWSRSSFNHRLTLS